MNLEYILITPQEQLTQVIEQMNRSGTGIVVVVDDERSLLGTVTDGDVRRALLDGYELSTTTQELLTLKGTDPPKTAVSVLAEIVSKW